MIKILGLHGSIPHYLKVNTDYNKYENLLCYGCLLLQKEDSRLVTFIEIRPAREASLVVVSCSKKEAYKFAEAVQDIAQGRNLYHGKKVLLGFQMRFLNLPSETWDDIALDDAVKNNIKANTAVCYWQPSSDCSGHYCPLW